MREILFKGKRLDNGEWVQGNVLYTPHGTAIMKPINLIFNDKYILIDPETVSQYTGLTDKNGTEIWENDIVTGLFLHGQSVYGKVTFEGGGFGLEWIRAGARTFTPFTSICNVTFEVVGNVFDMREKIAEACGNPALFK